VKKNNAGIK